LGKISEIHREYPLHRKTIFEKIVEIDRENSLHTEQNPGDTPDVCHRVNP
jgi:hypothetical protein